MNDARCKDCPKVLNERCLQCAERPPGISPTTGNYSTGQMLWDEANKGDPSQPLFD